MELTPETVAAIEQLDELREQVSKGLAYVARFAEQMQALARSAMPNAAPGEADAAQAEIRKIAAEAEAVPALRRSVSKRDGEAIR